jgi:hypothetical protein
MARVPPDAAHRVVGRGSRVTGSIECRVCGAAPGTKCEPGAHFEAANTPRPPRPVGASPFGETQDS